MHYAYQKWRIHSWRRRIFIFHAGIIISSSLLEELGIYFPWAIIVRYWHYLGFQILLLFWPVCWKLHHNAAFLLNNCRQPNDCFGCNIRKINCFAKHIYRRFFRTIFQVIFYNTKKNWIGVPCQSNILCSGPMCDNGSSFSGNVRKMHFNMLTTILNIECCVDISTFFRVLSWRDSLW